METESIAKILQNIFFGIWMLWENCEYYKSEDRIASLFRKVSN